VKTRTVTAKTVRDAARLGEIIGAAEMADQPVICRVDGYDCCGHLLEEYCVAAAIGVSEAAIWLWLRASAASAPRRLRMPRGRLPTSSASSICMPGSMPRAGRSLISLRRS